MDTHWGKYDGPLAALAERWSMDGDYGDAEYSDADGDGSGCILWEGSRRRDDGTWERASGPFSLSWRDAMYLRTEFSCSDDELTSLDDELTKACGILYSWDSRGFLYGVTVTTMQNLADIRKTIDDDNEQLARAQGWEE